MEDGDKPHPYIGFQQTDIHWAPANRSTLGSAVPFTLSSSNRSTLGFGNPILKMPFYAPISSHSDSSFDYFHSFVFPVIGLWCTGGCLSLHNVFPYANIRFFFQFSKQMCIEKYFSFPPSTATTQQRNIYSYRMSAKSEL